MMIPLQCAVLFRDWKSKPVILAAYMMLSVLIPSVSPCDLPGQGMQSSSSTPTIEKLEALLGISLPPDISLHALEGPIEELIDLKRDGWNFVRSRIVIADFTSKRPSAALRKNYRRYCRRDRLLVFILEGTPEHIIVSVHIGNAHPDFPSKRWIRITRYERIGE